MSGVPASGSASSPERSEAVKDSSRCGVSKLADVRAFKRPEAKLLKDEEGESAPQHAPTHDEFEEIFYRFGKPVLSFIYSMTGDRALAEELTQETFIRAFQNIGFRRAGAKISTWLFGIAHNVVREAVREKYRQKRSVALDEPALSQLRDTTQAADEIMISRETARHIQAAIASLPDDHRVAFVLKMIHRLQYEEISNITGASVGKLKTDTHRARLEVRRRMQPYLAERNFGMRGEP
jgi:RNA polymerase sigma-70 factor (ECF subfamily)